MAFNFQREPDFPLDFGGQQLPPQVGPFVKWGLLALGLILLFLVLSFLRGLYTDWLWFSNLGFGEVFARILAARAVLFLLGAGAFAVLLGASLYAANRFASGPVDLPLPEQVIEFLERLTFWGSFTVVVVLSIVFGAIMASRWQSFLKMINGVPFGITEPAFGRDVSFYVFTLPVYNFLQGWLLGASIMVLLVTVGFYFIKYSLRGMNFSLTPALKVHISIIAAFILFIIAGGHWLDRWELVLSNEGAVFGAAYTDIHARKPGLLVLTIIAISSGVLMLVNAYTRGLRLLAGAVGLWVVMAVVLGSIWPALMQQFSVTPNEFAKEEPYIARNIQFTRQGFALNRVQDVFYPVEGEVDQQLITNNQQTVSNIRLWDYRPLLDVYRQVQLIRPYYEFHGADVDRYRIDGGMRQVLLAAREVASGKLSDDAQTWVNTKMVYTHGIGLAMSPVTQFTPEGRPVFFAKDIPANAEIPIGAPAPGSSPEMLLTNPRIYYGEGTNSYVIANTKVAELDYQTADGDVFRNHYSGSGGVQMDSPIKRLAYAWQFGDFNLMISNQFTEESRIQYRRNIQERISTIAPFLTLDSDPYIVAAEGQLFWMQDAYTTSGQFPYSTPSDGSLNYMRNSVKVVVDAYNGTMGFYVWDTSDPIVRTYARMFPELFQPKEAMPESLQQHVRYPQDFFSIQSQKYLRYHMEAPLDFYNNEDMWAIPNEKLGQGNRLQPVEPYYVIMRLPGETSEEFVMLMPFTPSQRHNLIGWLAARSDGDNYGQLVAFNFPKDRQVDGPEQVEARIDNDPEISAWFTLRCSEGAICIRGNLLVIPMGNSLIYAEPVYVEAQGVNFPELKQVILASSERVVMRSSLSQALDALTGAEEQTGGETPTTSTIRSEIEQLESLLESVQGDISRLEEALQRLKQLTGGE